MTGQYKINISDLFRLSNKSAELVKAMPADCLSATITISPALITISWNCLANNNTLKLLGIEIEDLPLLNI
jgi:hypothetical protein